MLIIIKPYTFPTTRYMDRTSPTWEIGIVFVGGTKCSGWMRDA